MSVRLAAFRNAIGRLRDALDAPETDLHRDAAIQRFEFCFELAWKAVQERARAEGLDCVSPRSCLRLAFGSGWIEDEETWLAMLEDRNRASHTYDETLAKEIYSRLSSYLPAFEALAGTLGA